MKRKLLMLLMVVCMILPALPVFAAEQRVFDYADMIDDADEEEMHLWVQDMQENWGLDLAFLTTYDTEGKSVQEYGAEFYMEQDLGLGENYDGVIFVLDMGSREGQIITSGKAIDIYTDYYIDKMWDNMVDYLSEGDYYWAFFTLYCDLDHYAAEYEKYQADPDSYISEYQQETGVVNPFISIGVVLVLSLIIAGVGISVLKSGHNNVQPYTDGRAYLKEDGCCFTKKTDTFASTHTTMVPVPDDDDDQSWGGSSSTFSSGGRSFGGGGGKF